MLILEEVGLWFFPCVVSSFKYKRPLFETNQIKKDFSFELFDRFGFEKLSRQFFIINYRTKTDITLPLFTAENVHLDVLWAKLVLPPGNLGVVLIQYQNINVSTYQRILSEVVIVWTIVHCSTFITLKKNKAMKFISYILLFLFEISKFSNHFLFTFFMVLESIQKSHLELWFKFQDVICLNLLIFFRFPNFWWITKLVTWFFLLTFVEINIFILAGTWNIWMKMAEPKKLKKTKSLFTIYNR